MAPNYTRLDSIQSRGINVAKRTTFVIRRGAMRAASTGAAFTHGAEVAKIEETLLEAVTRSYIAGFEVHVPERGINTVARQYGINLDELRERFGHEARTQIQDFFRTVTNSLETTISELHVSGASTNRIKGLMRTEFERLGLTGNPYRIEAIFNTATTTAFNAGMWAAFRLPQNQENIWGFRYQTQKDDRVRDNHREMQDFTRPKDDPTWQVYAPPNGYNCRCFLEVLEEPAQSTPVPNALPDPGFRSKPYAG